MKDSTIQAMKHPTVNHGYHSALIESPTHAPSETQKNPATQAHSGPSHEVIAKHAYAIYLKNGKQQGHCAQDWQQAEKELRTVHRQLTSGKNP